MLKRSPFHTNSCAETFAPLISCVIDDTLLSDVRQYMDQALLQFINIVNLLDPLLHLFHVFVVSCVQICAVGWQKVW